MAKLKILFLQSNAYQKLFKSKIRFNQFIFNQISITLSNKTFNRARVRRLKRKLKIIFFVVKIRVCVYTCLYAKIHSGRPKSAFILYVYVRYNRCIHMCAQENAFTACGQYSSFVAVRLCVLIPFYSQHTHTFFIFVT